MALVHMIAHQLQRANPEAQASVKLRETCLPQDGRVEECFRELKHCVMRRFSKDYGRFSDDHGAHPLSSWLGQYVEEKLSFESVTQKAMQHFKQELDKTEVVTDGFLFFAYEKMEFETLLHIFFVQHNTGQYIDGDAELNESFYLDTGNICLAAKVNITDWQSGDAHRSSNALMLLRWRGEKELTDVFANGIGFAEKVDLSADTEAFLEVVSEYTQDLPDNIAHHTKKQVVDYCLEQDKIGKPVVIEELSTQLTDNPAPVIEKINGEETVTTPKLPDFAAFVSETKPAAKPELIPDKTQLRQYVRLSGRDNRLSMSFSSSCLGDTITYDPSSESLTIKNIPPSLKSRLAKYLQNSVADDT